MAACTNWLTYQKGNNANPTIKSLLDIIKSSHKTLNDNYRSQMNSAQLDTIKALESDCRAQASGHAPSVHALDCPRSYDEVQLAADNMGLAVVRAQAGQFGSADALVAASIEAMNHGGGK